MCGGYGTRLRSVLPLGYPKCLADINGRPFLAILLEHLRTQGFRRIILATGYGVNHILDYLDTTNDDGIVISHELRPQGTWASIQRAARNHVKTDPFLVLNGDTFCALNYADMIAEHRRLHSILTVAMDGNQTPVGAFVISKLLLALHVRAGGKNLEDLIERARGYGQVDGYVTRETWWDIGTPEGLRVLSHKLSLQHHNLGV